MSSWRAWPRASAPAALGGLVSLAAQGLLALALLRLFSPEEVGVFSVTSQLAFFWASLALAQSPLSLLAEQRNEPRAAARLAWRQSVGRMLWLAPVAALAAVWSGLAPLWQVWAWAAALCLVQLSWLLAQSLTLRVGSRADVAWVRMLPPLLAATLALWGAWFFTDRTTQPVPVLLVAACLGYAVGASWMRLAFEPEPPAIASPAQSASSAGAGSASFDPRSPGLKMLHTLMDGLAATALALSWPAQHGVQEAGWLLALWRIFSFVPALVHTAWAQVLLSDTGPQRWRSVHVALMASAAVWVMGWGVSVAPAMGWLDARWQGVSTYVWPLVVWQMAACGTAALAHLPFQKGLTSIYSWWCVMMQVGFILGCLGGAAVPGLSASAHMVGLSSYMAVCLTGLTLFLSLKSAHP